jgi:hypothetical protein
VIKLRNERRRTIHEQSKRTTTLIGPECDWAEARWIPPPASMDGTFSYWHCRRRFTLHGHCHRAVLFISADLLYTIREKGVWSGDVGATAVPTAMVCYGDDPIIRYFIGLFTAHPESNRFLHTHGDTWFPEPVRAPGWFVQPLRFACALCDYVYYSDTEPLFREVAYPVLRNYMAYLARLRNHVGLIENPPGTQWLDWAPVDNGRGEGAPQNLFYCLLLRKLSALARTWDDGEAASEWDQTAGRVEQEIICRFWDADIGLYVDSVADGVRQTRVYSEHTNCLALLAGLGSDGRAESMAAHIAGKPENLLRADVLFMLYTVQGLFAAGLDVLALRTMKERYERMRRAGGDTIWEEWSYLMSLREGTWHSRYRALAHGGASAPPFVLSTEVLGIKPTSFGFRSFCIRPNWGELSDAEGEVPTPAGQVEVRWRWQEAAYLLEVTVPPGTTASVHLPWAGAYVVDGAAMDHGTTQSMPATRRLAAKAGLVVSAPPGTHRYEAEQAVRS